MNATIISVGDELLIGKTVNTNLAYLTSVLFSIGVKTDQAVCVPDRKKSIETAIAQATGDLILFTGGLGPTKDDLTKETVCAYYDLPLKRNETVLRDISTYFSSLNRTMSEANHKQADFPQGATILKNGVGTAPGMILDIDGKIIVLLPGPPTELKPMFQDVIAYLKPLLEDTVYQKGYLVVGRGESDMESDMQAIYERHADVVIAPYASLGEITYLFTAHDEDKLNRALKDFRQSFSAYIIGRHDQSIEQVVVNLLMDTGKTISFAESCTGGMVSSRLVNVPDVSKVFKESYVLYDNTAKIKQLGVNSQIIERHGAVSEQCVYELCYQLAQRTGADITLSVSGIAGPKGGSEEKPVGTVYFGIHFEGKTHTYHRRFSGDRNMVRTKATVYGLFLIWKALMHDESQH